MKRSCAGWKSMRELNSPCSNKHHIREECGVFGVFSPERKDLAPLTYYGLFALQHRARRARGSSSMTTAGQKDRFEKKIHA